MAWYIASIPFWFSGFLCLILAPCMIIWKKPNETGLEVVGQFVFYLILAMIFLPLAAKISS